MGQEVLKKFDRYFLLDCLAQGGMAEIFRARPAAMDSAARILVIKRILAAQGRNQDFYNMFQSETKVMMGFNHPNVIQLFDCGESKNQPFICMEYVDGKNLRQFLTKFRDKKKRVPIDVAVYVIEQAAAGLHYAHTYKDRLTGEHLNIVHRDVSPQNILLSYDGNVKLIDFGIAKAKTNSESTRVGVIKGKPSYLSPEQVNGKELDGRSDVFSLGAVLWEILAGKKLFAAKPGESEFAVLKLIESAETYVKPPSQVNRDVPDELDYIVLKSLAKDKKKRFQSAGEFQFELRKFLNRNFPEFNPSGVSIQLKNYFEEAIQDDRKRLQALNNKAEKLLRESGEKVEATDPFQKVHAGTAPPSPPPKKEVVEDPGRVVKRTIDVDAEFNDQDSQTKSQTTSKSDTFAPGSSSTADARIFTPTGESSIVFSERSSSGIIVPNHLNDSDSRVGSFSRSHMTIPRTRISQPQIRKGSPLLTLLAVAAGIGGVVFFAPRLGISIPSWVTGLLADRTGPMKTEPVPAPVPEAKSKPRSEPGTILESVSTPQEQARTESQETERAPASEQIILEIKYNRGFSPTTIRINGQRVAESDPRLDVPLDQPIKIELEREGFAKWSKELTLQSAQLKGQSRWIEEVRLDPLRFGSLSVQSTPSAEVTITRIGQQGQEGPSIKMKTPIKQGRFPAGTYRIELNNQVLGMSKTIVKKIEEGTTLKVDERLEVDN